MDTKKALSMFLPEVLLENFDIDNIEKTSDRFDIWMDERNEKMSQDRYNKNIVSNGFGNYHTIQDFPVRGRATYIHIRKRKWLDKETGEIFSYQWDISEYDGTRLNAEFVAFLKEGD